MPSSKLAARLLVDSSSVNVQDFLWSKADFSEISYAPAPISANAAVELASSLTGLDASVFASKVYGHAAIDALIKDASPTILRGLLGNAYLSDVQLEKIALSKDASVLEGVKTLKEYRKKLTKKLSKSSFDAHKLIDEAIAKKAHNSWVSLLVGGDSENVQIALGAIVQDEMPPADDDSKSAKKARTESVEKFNARLEFRSKVLDAVKALDEDTHSSLMLTFLGLGGEVEKAQVIDSYIAKWLCSGESFEAEAATAMLVPEGGVRKSIVAGEFSGRLSPASRQLFKDHDVLWDVVAYRRTDEGTSQRHPDAAGRDTDFSQLMTLRLAGLSALQVSGSVFSTTCTLTPDELIAVLEDLDAHSYGRLLSGEYPRRLTNEQAKAILDEFDDDGKAIIAEVLKGSEDKENPRPKADPTLIPWGDALIEGLPGMWFEYNSPQIDKMLLQAAISQLGVNDVNAWARLLNSTHESLSFEQMLASAK